MLSPNLLLRGSADAPPVALPLQAGPMRLMYYRGDLRYLRLGDHEVLRRIYVAVRDRNWGTIPATIEDERIEAGEHFFQISYVMHHRQREIDFLWQAQITGEPDGTIRFSMDGEARSTFWRKRIGICVLHPLAASGAACRITHIDGSSDHSHFPLAIAPQALSNGVPQPVPPFADVASLAHEVAPGMWAEVGFAGEIFELEDQRNWIDASYKTYSTPQRLPSPVEVPAGTLVRQSITIHVNAPAALAEAAPAQEIPRLTPRSAAPVALQPIGLCVASDGLPLSERELARLRVLRPAHLRVDLRLAEQYESRLRQASAEAAALDVPLMVALFLGDAPDAELQGVRRLLDDLRPQVAAWLVFHTQEAVTGSAWVQLARSVLGGFAPGALFVGGTNAYFTDLNRGRPVLDGLDRVTYSINPQVHAFDDLSLIETPMTIPATIASARTFCGALPLQISPVTLKPRFNPGATNPTAPLATDELPRSVDPRQMSLLGACWTLASLKQIVEAGVTATYYETAGWLGVMEREQGAPLPEHFPSLPGGVFPLYHVLADANAFAGGSVLPLQSSDPLALEGLALQLNTRSRLIIANLLAQPRRVSVAVPGAHALVRFLDETNAEWAMREPEAFRDTPGVSLPVQGGTLELELLPYAIARLDISR